MSDAAADLEAVLHAAYLREADCYAQALRLADGITEACCRGEPMDERLQRMLGLLDEVASRQAGLARMKQEWERSQRTEDRGQRTDGLSSGLGPELRAVTERIAGLIEQMAGRLKAIEQTARAHRDRLAVELDVCNRRRQMQRAYLGQL